MIKNKKKLSEDKRLKNLATLWMTIYITFFLAVNVLFFVYNPNLMTNDFMIIDNIWWYLIAINFLIGMEAFYFIGEYRNGSDWFENIMFAGVDSAVLSFIGIYMIPITYNLVKPFIEHLAELLYISWISCLGIAFLIVWLIINKHCRRIK